MPVPTITCWVPNARLSDPICGAEFDEDVPVVSKMNEMFAFVGTKHISSPGSDLTIEGV